MKLGFYYHVEASVVDGVLYMPALLGVFIEDLSKRVERLTLFIHLAAHDAKLHDYPLSSNRIDWIDIGAKHSFPYRLFCGKKSLRSFLDKEYDLDLLLVRAPTPLAPALYATFSKKCRVVFLIVGDYSMQSNRRFSASWFMNCIYEWIMNNLVLPHCLALVNSSALQKKYREICTEIIRVKTTTLRKSDFYFRDDTCLRELLHILYVGRYDWQKGLKELFESVAILKNKFSVMLHLVGWDTDIRQRNLQRMRNLIAEFDIEKNVIIEGYKKVGDELNEMYKNSDVFVIPSYAEGFPRCIWEAMANGVPVVATTVGGIPEVLTNAHDGVLVPPKNTELLTEAIEKVFTKAEFRRNLIRSAYDLVTDVTLDVQNDRIVSALQNELDKQFH